MRQLHLCIAALIITLAAANCACAVMMLPGEPPAGPQPSAAEIDAAREAQQAEAPMIEGAEVATDTATATTQDLRRSDEEQQTESFAEALALRDEVEGPDAVPEAPVEVPARTQSKLLVMAGAAGLLGLTLGRFAMNSLSRTSLKEAEQAVEAEDIDDGSRSLGGDHREYIIE